MVCEVCYRQVPRSVTKFPAVLDVNAVSSEYDLCDETTRNQIPNKDIWDERD